MTEVIAGQVAEAIQLDAEWVSNLLAVVMSPLACIPKRALPHPSRRVVEAMRGAGLLAGWDKRGERGERIGLYVTLTPWSAHCLGMALERIPYRGQGRWEIEKKLRSLDLDLEEEEHVQWGYAPPRKGRNGIETSWSAHPEALGEAGYRLPTLAIREEEDGEGREAGRCATPGCRRGVGPGQERCLKCRESALRKLVREHDQERQEERGERKRRGA